MLHRNAADFAKERIALAGTNDGLAHPDEHGVEAIGAHQPLLRVPAHGNLPVESVVDQDQDGEAQRIAGL